MTLSKTDAILQLGWLKGIIDMGIKEDDQAIKDDAAEVIDDLRAYLEVEK
jgi:energy-converting hydrogenase A subunit M